MAPYGVSKGGLVNFTMYAARELAADGIRVNCIAPGWVMTPMAKPFFEEAGAIGKPVDFNMLQRPGQPEEIARVAVFLAGEGALVHDGRDRRRRRRDDHADGAAAGRRRRVVSARGEVVERIDPRSLIGGEPIDGAAAAIDVIDPATGETLLAVGDVGAAGVEAAVAAARRAQPAWGRLEPRARAAALLSLAQLVEEHADLLAKLEAVDVGKPIDLTPAEIASAVDKIRFFAGACRTLPATAADSYRAPYASHVRREPVGVVAALAPWNYPFALAVGRRARARGRQRRRAEAVAGDAALDARLARDHPGRTVSCRPACSTSSRATPDRGRPLCAIRTSTSSAAPARTGRPQP